MSLTWVAGVGGWGVGGGGVVVVSLNIVSKGHLMKYLLRA